MAKQRTKVVKVLVDGKEHNEFAARARGAHQSISSFVRNTILYGHDATPSTVVVTRVVQRRRSRSK